MKLTKVGILPRDEVQTHAVQEAQELFAQRQIETVRLDAGGQPAAGLDLVMALGGDGTVLKALDLFPGCPVLAINFGTVGFLTAGDRRDLEQIIAFLLEGRFFISERLVLQCRYPGGEARAINEVIVRTSNRLIFTDVYVEDTKIRTIQGDGVVVGTPTGSTAFLLAAGAPIVMPDVRCIILDGINEYNFTSRSLILTPESRIRLHISHQTRDPYVYLTVDGRQLGPMSPGQEVHICRSEQSAHLVYFHSDYFFHNLSSKLSW